MHVLVPFSERCYLGKSTKNFRFKIDYVNLFVTEYPIPNLKLQCPFALTLIFNIKNRVFRKGSRIRKA